MTRSTVLGLQLGLVVDPHAEPGEAEQVAIEAAITEQEWARTAGARFTRPCRCSRPWPFAPGWCVKCGREVARLEERLRA